MSIGPPRTCVSGWSTIRYTSARTASRSRRSAAVGSTARVARTDWSSATSAAYISAVRGCSSMTGSGWASWARRASIEASSFSRAGSLASSAAKEVPRRMAVAPRSIWSERSPWPFHRSRRPSSSGRHASPAWWRTPCRCGFGPRWTACSAAPVPACGARQDWRAKFTAAWAATTTDGPRWRCWRYDGGKSVERWSALKARMTGQAGMASLTTAARDSLFETTAIAIPAPGRPSPPASPPASLLAPFG